MALPDTSKRLRDGCIQQDIASLRGAKGIRNFTPLRPEAEVSNLSQIEQELNHLYEIEIQLKAKHKAALDAVREAEWKFHNGVQALKSSVIGQFGKNSNEAEAIGYKKQEDYKRPKRDKKSDAKEFVTKNT
ncbi:MAG: hypothetical protein KME13_01335 [Myxacorys californica WJT36-NPBG1]|jgi:hypothetical protein|nr:hypothetical protein [Myxacorys californica WJT36-NPBG1]